LNPPPAGAEPRAQI